MAQKYIRREITQTIQNKSWISLEHVPQKLQEKEEKEDTNQTKAQLDATKHNVANLQKLFIGKK